MSHDSTNETSERGALDGAIATDILERLADAVAVLGPDARVRHANAAAERLAGRSRAALVGRSLWDLFPELRGGPFQEAFERVAAGDGSVLVPASPYPGADRWLEAQLLRVVGGVCAVWRDVTARERPSTSPREAVRRDAEFRGLADNLPYVVARLDRAKRHTFVNRAAERATGLASDALLGKTSRDLGLPPALAAPWEAALDLAFGGVASTFAAALPSPDGARSFEARLVPELDDAGAVASVLVLADDVTEARRAEAEREQALAALDAVLTTAPVGIALLDRDLRFVRVNPRLAAMNGLPVEAHLGKTPMELLPGISGELITAIGRRVLDRGDAVLGQEIAGETPAEPGVQRHWLEHWYPIAVAGDIRGVGVIVDDITDRKRAEGELREAVIFRERFVAMVGHDLRNPLNAISMAADVLLRRADPADAATRMFTRIVTSSRRMKRMIDQLLDFARARQGGGLVVVREEIDLGELAQRAAEECRLAHDGARVDLRALGDLRGRWDPDRLAELLSNLIGNAILHGADRAARVSLTGEDAVTIEVHNDGPPIPPELVPHLFDPFRSGGAERAIARRSGLGLGLYIVKQIVVAHGGAIDVRSADGAGTTFCVSLPRVPPPRGDGETSRPSDAP